MNARSRTWRYRVMGSLTYGIVVDNELVGHVARTRGGWNGFTLDGQLVVEEYPGGRDTAAANTIARVREIEKGTK